MILLMAEILRSPVEGTVVYPIAYEVLAPSQVVGLGISSINSRKAPNHGATEILTKKKCTSENQHG